ncbi:type II secretion system F family protein [Piscinibacter sp. HJYY11]|uniref:type II secretion system F family protein n=1 Tax=Piscinibacter sp. HJYY11 TaxID=2801333 RepID=UPI00191CEB62|nr:type II secretion system F family protein [Piscinibacter sp. HJYY11]MBL0726167.1 type II secretion system F family protein [Piscinibacter sp. HJYY11]
MQAASLVVEAVDARDARRQIESLGYAVVAVRTAGARMRLGRAAALPLLHFNQSLLILLQAGLSVVEAIETLAERETRPEARRVLQALLIQLREGRSFSVALEAQPEAFPPLYVASVRANERTGALKEAIERFIHYRAQADLVRKRVVGAAIYPAMVLAVGALVIAFLLFYVVPRFSQVFQDLGDRIPASSRLLLEWGQFAHAHATGLLSTAAVTLAAVAYALTRPAVRLRIARALQRLPHLGEIIRVYRLARFYRALGMLQQAGMPIVASLELVRGLLPADMQQALSNARREIEQGRSISSAFELNGLTTSVSVRLLRAAEQTGQMGEMLERTAGFHEEDISQAIEWFIRLFEPMLMVAIGMIIGVVVLLMYAPIFELAGSLQ